MIRGRQIHNHLICLFSLLLLVSVSVFAQEMVRILPKATDEVLINPGMGFSTFGRFQSDHAADFSYPQTSIAYFRWYWDVLEPEKGKYDWSIMDNALLKAHQNGQTLMIRFMPQASVGTRTPKWYMEEARGEEMESRGQKLWQPDYTDPKFVEYWNKLIRECGRRYDGHPWLENVDNGALGFWGEWHTLELPSMPSWEIRKKLIDVYIESFTQTPLLMNIDGVRGTAYHVRHGDGWRADCWGDLRRPDWNHQYDSYPQKISATLSTDAWKHAPVSLETCGAYPNWYENGSDIDFIHDEALRWHATSINAKSRPIPEEWMPKVQQFLKKLGYRFELRKIEYPAKVVAGQMMPIQMWWVNTGVAPIYRRYNLALQLKNDRGSGLIRVDTDVTQWLPGDDVLLEDPVWVPDLAPGKYRMRVGLLDPFTGKPAVKLPLEGRTEDNWHDLGEIELVGWELE